jgi:hypothetical protein
MGYRANERGKLSEDFVAAGDGLGAFSAVFILPVQTHYGAAKAVGVQWFCAKQGRAGVDLKTDKQDLQIEH